MISKKIKVRANTVVGNAGQPLITAFEANIDPDIVHVNRSEAAIRSISPLEFIVQGVSMFLFTEYVLKPLINPVVEKFNWHSVVDKFRNPHQPLRVIVSLEEDKLNIEIGYELEQEHIKRVWENIHQSLEILKENKLIPGITKIRFDNEDSGKLLVICYQDKKPSHVVNLEEKELLIISNVNQKQYQELSVSEKIKNEAQKYRRYVEKLKDEQDR